MEEEERYDQADEDPKQRVGYIEKKLAVHLESAHFAVCSEGNANRSSSHCWRSTMMFSLGRGCADDVADAMGEMRVRANRLNKEDAADAV